MQTSLGSYQSKGFLAAHGGSPGNLICFPLSPAHPWNAVSGRKCLEPLSVPPRPGEDTNLAGLPMALTKAGSQLVALFNAIGIKILLLGVSKSSLFPSSGSHLLPLHTTTHGYF